MTADERRPDPDEAELDEDEEWDEDDDEEDDEGDAEPATSAHVAGALSQFLVQGPLLGWPFPFIVAFSYLMWVLTWPWALLAGWLISRPPRLIQPHLLFRCIVRSIKQFGSTADELGRLGEGATAEERRALRVFPLMILSDLDVSGFRRVVLRRAPFTLRHVGTKKLRVDVGTGEPLSRGEQVLVLSFASFIPLIVVVGVLAALLKEA